MAFVAVSAVVALAAVVALWAVVALVALPTVILGYVPLVSALLDKSMSAQAVPSSVFCKNCPVVPPFGNVSKSSRAFLVAYVATMSFPSLSCCAIVEVSAVVAELALAATIVPFSMPSVKAPICASTPLFVATPISSLS